MFENAGLFKDLISLFIALVHSHLSYSLCVYGATIKSNLDEILKLQKQAVRIYLCTLWMIFGKVHR